MNMKFLFSMLALFFMAFTVSAQNSGAGRDTITASDTLFVYPNGTSEATMQKFVRNGNLDVGVVTDSISGATNATTVLQYGVKDEDGNVMWATKATLTSNGVGEDILLNEDTDFGTDYFRLRTISPSGTQSTDRKWFWRFKPN